MTQTPTKKQQFMGFLTWFAIFYVIFFFAGQMFSSEETENVTGQAVEVAMDKNSYVLGHAPMVTVTNKGTEPIAFVSPCENEGSSLQMVQFGESSNVSCLSGQIAGFTLGANEGVVVNLSSVANDWFAGEGQYKLNFVFNEGENSLEVSSGVFEVGKPGIFRQLYRALITKPLFNGLVFLVDKAPHHSLGIAIIMLTLIVRLILFAPNQKAMASQRELQKLQPKIAEMKEKHKGNQQMIAMKTMELYKTHKINPMSSCLPILLQMPFLLGLYQIIQQGLVPHMAYFLYDFQSSADLTVVDKMFLGMNLSVPNVWVLPFLVGGAQFLAIKLSMVRQKKNNEKNGKVTKKKSDNPMAEQMEHMSKMMLWMMPLMIAGFTFVLPAGVGLYWLTSTIFGIGQQWFVNHQLDKPKVVRKV